MSNDSHTILVIALAARFENCCDVPPHTSLLLFYISPTFFPILTSLHKTHLLKEQSPKTSLTT